ncbi:Endonuclease/exonuclease/phosphatase [Phascolomyces articulosus]|uniref:sphingomyelin phosphodiesterase n=1 Tax=Phascolomyces articulosus TaxID=60185 RepID=A0AAD5P9W6_9FUNG|nr:Endonuclease/exonuclease/phosphatase [Phascolomyces articulosus]
MNTAHDDNSERITLRSHEGARHSEPLILNESDFEQNDPAPRQQHSPYHDDADNEEEEAQVDNSNDNDRNEQQQRAPLLRRSHSQESAISTDSAPPPYEFYPPAKTLFGRAYNWIRTIPRIRRRQAIALPTLPLHQRFYSRHSDSLSSTSIDSFASSAYPATCCSYYFHVCMSRFPSLPRATLPTWLARCRWVLICISIFAILLFAFLLFCSIFFAPASLSPPIVPDLSTDISARFLSLNIFMRPPGVTNNYSDYKEERLDYIVRYILPQYDVVAFQEAFAFGTRRKDQLIQRARNMGFNHHVESPRHYPWDLGVDGGLLIMSRFPIRTSHTIEYPRGIHSDWLSYKGALHALIEINPIQSLHLYTTHAQASYAVQPSQADIQVRLGQFAQLHQFIKETTQRDNNIPILLLGDFNVDAAVHDGSITEHSKSSSVEYQMMMDVLNGKGVDLGKTGHRSVSNDNISDSDNEKSALARKRLYADPSYQLDLSDKVYKQYGYHPVTFGDIVLNKNGEVEPAETILTDPEQVMTVQSIDRVFWDQMRAVTSTMKVQEAQVEKFLVRNNDMMSEFDKQQAPFTQVSDHYGLSCVVQLS